MKRVLISATVSILTVCGLYAQDVKFGIRGGLNMSNMPVAKSTPASEDYKSRMAPAWGLFTEMQLNPMFSIRLGVEYNGLGGKKDGMQAMPTGRLVSEAGSNAGLSGLTPEQELALGGLMMWSATNPYYYVNVNNTVKFDYVTLPLLAQFGWDVGTSPWRVYVNAGPFVSFILSVKQVSKGTSKMFADVTGTNTLWNAMPTDIKDPIVVAFPEIATTLSEQVTFGETNISGEMKSTNFGITGNVGVRYQHNRNYFFLEVGGNYGFISVQDNDASGSNRLSAVSVMAGYAFSLF